MDWTLPAIRKLIELSLKEDATRQDLTSETLIPKNCMVRAELRAKEPGVVAGLPLAEAFFKAMDSRIQFKPLLREGSPVRTGTVMARIKGRARSVLSGERSALNALQHLSGIATFTGFLVKALGSSRTQLLDTRKTLPGWRLLEKYAVRMGGGKNHRMSLSEAVLVKDNHLKICRLAGEDWMTRLKKLRRRRPTLPIQVEIQTEQDLEEVLRLKPPMVLLDNLSTPVLKSMIRRLRQSIPHVQIEVSGGIKPAQLPGLARLGVDRISMGRLTHSSPAFDCSLEITHVDPR